MVLDKFLFDDARRREYFWWNSCHSPQYKLFYVATPKVACTSLKWWFADLEGISRAAIAQAESVESDPELVIHDTFHKVAPHVTGLSPEQLTELLSSEEYFRFAVVRNPYRRIFSAWQSKLLLREPLQCAPYQSCEFFNLPIESVSDITSAFEAFLEHLSDHEAPNFWDFHWMPQVNLLRPDLISYTQISRIEHVNALSQALAKHVGTGVPNPFGVHRTNESLIPYKPELISDRASELIRTLYTADFEAFGYSLEVPANKDQSSPAPSDVVLNAIKLIRGRHQRLDEIRSTSNLKIDSLKQVVADRDGQITGLNQTMAERDDQITGLNQVVADLEGRIAERIRLVAVRDQELIALRNSKSWRITKPLRFATALLRGIRKEFYFVDARGLKSKVAKPNPADQKLILGLDMLPNGFDRDEYLKLNPDVALAGWDPKTHYLLHGRYEGRIYSLPVLCADYHLNMNRETILVVSHEASRTGAPMLSLNLVQTLVGPYNVVVLLLGSGPLSDEFQRAGAAVVTSSNLGDSPILVNLTVGQLCQSYTFKFALVNSIESRVVLSKLGEYFVPTISLIHEFASYTRPRDAFRHVFFWSGEVVFSANIVLENTLAEYPDLGSRITHVLPQGRCLLPLGELSEEQLQAERARIRHLIRPKAIAENSVIVLGAGFVQLRKGVDLFIDCAARMVHMPEGDRCRFVWIGKGYDPETDIGYSVYLEDQIRRAGLQEHVFFVDETTAIETAYEEADLFLLSSRLDPLPNVAIDALAHGVPVVCFNRTTGIADFLNDCGLQNHCVAEYLDSADMAEKLAALVGSPALRKLVADRCQNASRAYFNMGKYVARIEILAQSVCDRTQQEKADTQVILGSGLFRGDFSSPEHPRSQSNEAEVRAYVRAWASGVGRRKPFPGFHPGIYLEQHGLSTAGADPLADYLRTGQPDGPWNYAVITSGETKDPELPDNQRVALHLHVYYPELFAEISTRLSRIRIRPDLFISVTNEKALKFVISELKDYTGNIIDIRLVPNRGRDIGPFLTVFGPTLVANYDFVGHIHTKKTANVKDTTVGKVWYRFLLENLLGGQLGSMADSILAKMYDDSSIGMVFPDDPNIIGWGANRTFGASMAVRVGLQALPEHFVFPVGSMFWARTSALVPLMELKLDWDDYPEEPLPYDGTSLHAIERLFSLVLSKNNLQSATTNAIGLTR